MSSANVFNLVDAYEPVSAGVLNHLMYSGESWAERYIENTLKELERAGSVQLVSNYPRRYKVHPKIRKQQAAQY